MTRRVKKKLAEVESMPEILQNPDGVKGNWKEKVFRNKNELVLELGCGRGEYTVALSEKYQDKNFIGIDVKGPRLWAGAKKLQEKGLKNARFLRIRIDNIEDYFDNKEVDTIWITFPDPYPKPSKANKRLVSQNFLEKYAKVVKPDADFYFKTDNTDLFEFGLETLEANSHQIIDHSFNLYESGLLNEHTGIETYYEKKFREEGFNIKYLHFKLNLELFK